MNAAFRIMKRGSDPLNYKKSSNFSGYTGNAYFSSERKAITV
jgi:hypothetical protein